jgi:hypothetical protein
MIHTTYIQTFIQTDIQTDRYTYIHAYLLNIYIYRNAVAAGKQQQLSAQTIER